MPSHTTCLPVRILLLSDTERDQQAGLVGPPQRQSKDVRTDTLAWYRAAKGADWDSFAAVWEQYPDVDLVNGLLVFNICQNRFRLIVYPAFSRRKLYIKA